MAEERRKKRAAMRVLERRLIIEWPEVFDAVCPRPLAIGIHKAIRAATGVSGAIVLDEWNEPSGEDLGGGHPLGAVMEQVCLTGSRSGER